MLLRGVEPRRGSHLHQHMNDADGKAKQEYGGYPNWSDVEVAVLPQFAAHRPVHEAGGRDRGGGDSLRLERRFGHHVRMTRHRAAPCACSPRFPTTATNKSAMLGVRTSPRATAC